MKKTLGAQESYLYPTPCVLVSCGKKKPNIITVAWCGVLCSSPPTIGVSIRPQRYSYPIIMEEKAFGVNIPTADMAEKVDICGTTSGRNVDKFKLCGFTPFEGKHTGIPLIKECPVNIECTLKQTVELGVHTLFIGEVVEVYITEKLKEEDIKQLNPLAYIPITGEYVSIGSIVGSYGFSRRRG